MMDMELSWTNRCWDLGSTLTRLLDAGDIEVAPIVVSTCTLGLGGRTRGNKLAQLRL